MFGPTRSARRSAPFEKAGQELAAYVANQLSHVDAALLDEAIDRVLADPTYRKLYQQLLDVMPWTVVERFKQRRFVAFKPDGVPEIVADRVVLAVQIECELARVLSRLTDRFGEPSPASADVPSEVSLVTLMFDPNLPYQLRAAMIDGSIGQVCSFALASQRVTSSLLADALVEKWLHGVRSTLGIMIAILSGTGHHIEVDPPLLPTKYRVDFSTMVEEFAASQRGLAFALDEVAQTGRAYPPEEH